MINPFSRSLPLRLLAIFIATSIIAVIVLSETFSRGLGSQWRQTIQPHLERYVRYVLDDLGSPPDVQRAHALAAELPLEIYVYTHEQFDFSTSGQQLSLNTLVFSFRPPQSAELPPDEAQGRLLDVAGVAWSEGWRRTVVRAQRGKSTVYIELDRHTDHFRHAPQLRLALGLLLLILLGCYWLIRRQFTPIETIQQGVRAMSLGQLDHRIRLKGTDDLAQLGNSVDAMADRIQAMLDAKRQLLLALSHELRTPLTRVRVATELLPDSTNRDRIRNDIDEMQTLISDILESERLQQHAVLHLVPVDMRALVTSVIEEFDAEIALRAPIEGICLLVDPVRMTILVRNLIANALEHGRPVSDASMSASTSVSVSLQSAATELQIEVADQGPGIATEHRAAVTDAFYRADPARVRDTGGFGLGLTLVKLIAEAHGGSLRIDSEPETRAGTRVTVRLPADRRAHPRS